MFECIVFHESNMKYLNLLPCKLCPSDNYLMQNLNEQQQDQIFMQLAFDPNFKNYIYYTVCFFITW